MATAKVRQIYDALDARNPKQALKLCNAALGKQAQGPPLISALKAIALERLGKNDEALVVARAVAASKPPPTDDVVLSTLQIAFKALGHAQEATAAYEAAFAANPGDGEMASLLFSSYMKSSEWAKAQQLALKNYKQPGGEEQMYWAIACILIQVDLMSPPRPLTRQYAEAPAPASAAKHLALAAAMCGRAASQGKLTTEAQLLLYLEVLKRQGADEAACAAMEAHGALIGAAEDRLRLVAELHEKRGLWREAQAAHTEILRAHMPEDWEAFLGLMRNSLRATEAPAAAEATEPEGGGAAERGSPAVAASEASVSAAAQALADLSAAAEGTPSRPARLALIWLQLAALAPADACAAFAPTHPNAIVPVPSAAAAAPPAAPISADACAALLAALAEFFEAFAEKPVCFLDTKPVLAALRASPAARRALLDPLTAAYDEASPPSPPSLPWLRRFTTACQWRLGCGETAGWDAAARMATARRWSQVYHAAAPLSSELDARERGHADTLALLSAQMLLQRPTSEWVSADGDGVTAWPLEQLLAAALGLRAACDASPHNVQLAIGLLSTLAALGAPTAAHSIYTSCGIKQIQNETLSHTVLPALHSYGAAFAEDASLHTVRRFQATGMRDLPDNLSLAFESSSYSQALEFVSFRRSMESSWWRMYTDVMNGLSLLRAHKAAASALRLELAAIELVSLEVAELEISSIEGRPDPLDLSFYEDHLPLPAGARLAGLRSRWLPRHARLIRLIFASLGDGDGDGGGGADGGAASVDLQRETDALCAFVRSHDFERSAPSGAGPVEQREDWRALLALADLNARIHSAGRGERALAEAVPALAEDFTRLFAQQCGLPAASLAAEGGYLPIALARVAMVAHVAGPTLCVLASGWAALLAAKRRKKGGGDAEGAGADGGADPMNAARASARGALEAAVSALGALRDALGAAHLVSAACASLGGEAGDAWEAELGSVAAAASARKVLLAQLSAAGAASVAELGKAIQNCITPLELALKKL